MKIKRTIIFVIILAAAVSAGVTHVSCTRKVKRAPADVVFITIDTVRADHLGAYGYKFIKTPNMDRLASEGALFEQVRVPTALTLPSHTTIFTGLYPPAHGVRDNGAFEVPKGLPTLAQILRKSGYNTGAVIASFVLERRFGLEQGFDSYDDSGLMKDTGDIFFYAERPASEVTDRALAWLNSVAGPGSATKTQKAAAGATSGNPKRFFLWAHYFDAHFPYKAPAPYDSEYKTNPYDGEIAYVDSQIGRLLDGVYKLRGKKDLLVVIVADHGESLGDHGEMSHGLFIYDSTVHVPLIFYAPGRISARRIPYRISSVDITPTVLDLLGISPTTPMQGESLLTMLEGKGKDRVAYLESAYARLHYGWSELRGLAADGYTVIESPKPELYAFSDTDQERDLAGEKNDLVQSLLKRIHVLLSKLTRPGINLQSERQSGADVKRQLEALGYITLKPKNMTTAEIEPISGVNPADKKYFQFDITKVMTSIHTGNFDEGHKILKKLIADDPDNTSLYLLEGITYERANDYVNARESYLKALSIDPRFESPLIRLAEVEIKLKKIDSAREYLNKALKVNPTDIDGYRMLGMLEYKEGNIERAREVLEMGVSVAPSDSGARLALGKFYVDTSEYLKAKEQLEKGLAIAPSDTQLLILTGKMRLLTSDRKGAIAALSKATEISPNSAEAHFWCAYALETGSDDTLRGPDADFGGAQQHYRRVIEINPNYLKVRQRLDLVEKAIVRTGGVP